MKKMLFAFAILFILLLIFGCDKERTVTSTEYIKEIEYIEKPADTILVFDTLYTIDTLVQYDTTFTGSGTDTIIVIDTVFSTESHYDTVTIVDTITVTNNIYDTVTVTVDHFDTVTVTENHYDTTTIIQCDPFVQFAFAAMQYYGNPEILTFINSEFGYTDGWVYFLSIGQCDIQSPSAGVYEIYGYANYWTVEFDGYYPLEYFWRLTFDGGDPSDPDNWTLDDPPSRSSSKTGGVRLSVDKDVSTIGTTIINR